MNVLHGLSTSMAFEYRETISKLFAELFSTKRVLISVARPLTPWYIHRYKRSIKIYVFKAIALKGLTGYLTCKQGIYPKRGNTQICQEKKQLPFNLDIYLSICQRVYTTMFVSTVHDTSMCNNKISTLTIIPGFNVTIIKLPPLPYPTILQTHIFYWDFEKRKPRSPFPV